MASVWAAGPPALERGPWRVRLRVMCLSRSLCACVRVSEYEDERLLVCVSHTQGPSHPDPSLQSPWPCGPVQGGGLGQHGVGRRRCSQPAAEGRAAKAVGPQGRKVLPGRWPRQPSSGGPSVRSPGRRDRTETSPHP